MLIFSDTIFQHIWTYYIVTVKEIYLQLRDDKIYFKIYIIWNLYPIPIENNHTDYNSYKKNITLHLLLTHPCSLTLREQCMRETGDLWLTPSVTPQSLFRELSPFSEVLSSSLWMRWIMVYAKICNSCVLGWVERWNKIHQGTIHPITWLWM